MEELIHLTISISFEKQLVATMLVIHKVQQPTILGGGSVGQGMPTTKAGRWNIVADEISHPFRNTPITRMPTSYTTIMFYLGRQPHDPGTNSGRSRVVNDCGVSPILEV